jgi:hypothetical protein
MYSRTVLFRSLLLFAAVVLSVFSPRAVHGQRLEDGQREYENKARATRSLRVDLFKGVSAADPGNKTHQEAADIAAKEVAYPLYWRTVGNQAPPPGKMNELVNEFESRLAQMTKFKAATSIFQQMYCRQVIERAQEVILRGKPIAAINAARMLAAIPARGLERGFLQSESAWVDDVLPRLAEGNAETLANAALTLLGTPKMNDGTKYYLLRTLSNLVGLPKQTKPLLKPETEEKAIAAAIKLVETKKAFARATPRAEVEGYKMLRCEAVRVVAASRTPVVGDKERPALTLARVAANDASIVPSPRINERIEAVIGLARMGATAAKFPDYQPDGAAEQIARAVRDFGIQADANREAKADLRSRAWKVDASRMLEALDVLKANVKNAYVQEVVKQCVAVLAPIENGGAGNGGNLGDWLSSNASPAKSVFKSGGDSTIKAVEEK